MPLSENKTKTPPPIRRRRLVPREKADGIKVVRVGNQRFWISDLYVHLLAMPWIEYAVIISAIYFLSNLAFAGVYWLDTGGIENARTGSFLDMYFFSVQTMATIGYGKMWPSDI